MASNLNMMVATATPEAVRQWQDNVTNVANCLPRDQSTDLVEDWKWWTNSYRSPVKSEVGEAITQALDEAAGATVHGATVTRDRDDDNFWFFEHNGKFLGQTGKVASTVIAISLDDGQPNKFCWLGVIENDETVTLSPEIKSVLGNEIRIKFKVLTSIESQNRQHRACSVDAPPYAAQLMGLSVPPVVVEFEPAPDSGLNTSQENAVQYWIGQKRTGRKKQVVPQFMLLQGPPGTGKTTTAVEIIRRSLAKEGSHLGVNRGNKIVCAAPTWAAVYQCAVRYLEAASKDLSVNKIRVVVTGRNDGKRSAVIEPEVLRHISSVSLVEDVQAWVDAEDRTDAGYAELKEKIRAVAPDFFDQHLRDYKRAGRNLEQMCQELGQLQEKLKAAVLEEAAVIFTTLNSLGSKYWTQNKKLRDSVGTLIVDEAGQATDPDLFIAYGLGTQRLLLLGDHRQLPPSARSKGAKQSGLGRSTLERLYDAGDKTAPHKHMLTVQYRMPHSVVAWPNQRFYGGQLKTAKAASGPSQYRVINVAFGKGARITGGTSWQNPAEAACVMRVVCRLRASYGLDTDLRDVLIITPYAAQRDLLQRHLLNCFGDVPRERLPTVSTIDGCQGDEREHVVLSLVRTDMQQVTSFATCPQHLCVALTRAKETMAVVCHAEALWYQSLDGESLVQHARETHCFEKLSASEVTTHSGTIVGKQFIGESGVVMQIGGLGYKVFHGDEVELRLLNDTLGGKLVVDVDVKKEAPSRKEEFVCSIVNDGHVCFYAPHRADRAEILHAVRALAEQGAGHAWNSAAVAVGERQPTDEDYFTLAVADKLVAERLMWTEEKKDALVVWIPDAKKPGAMKKVPASLPQEPYYNNFEPVDDRFPRVRIEAAQVRKHQLTYDSVVRVVVDPVLGPSKSAGRDDVWYANIKSVEPQPLELEDLLLTSVGAHVADGQSPAQAQEEAPVQGQAQAQEPVGEGGVFSIDEVDTRVFDDAVSCRKRDRGGWEVSLYITDPSAPDDALHNRLSEQLVDIHAGEKTKRLWDAANRESASLRSGEVRSCLCLTFVVDQNGAVSERTWALRETTVARNFFVSEDMSWRSFMEDQTPGEGPKLMEEAVRAMMEHTVNLEEAHQAYGPRHLLQYLVLCAKQAAADILRSCPGVLFANATPALDEARRVLCSIGANVGDGTEQALRHAFNELPPTLRAAVAASVRQPAKWSTTYVEGVSMVSFTSPLRKLNDFDALQRLKALLFHTTTRPAASAVVLHQRKLDEQRKQRINRELKDARKPETGLTTAIVTQVDGDCVTLYCEKTGMLFEASATTLGKDAVNKPFVTTYQARVVSANKKTFVRHQTHHIVPYIPESPKPIVGVKRSQAAPQENTDKAPQKKFLTLQFAGERVKVTRSKDEVRTAMLKLISSNKLASYIWLTQDKSTGSWKFYAKSIVCDYDKKCNRDICNFIHTAGGVTPDTVRKTYVENLPKLKECAKKVGNSLSCTVLAVPPGTNASSACGS